MDQILQITIKLRDKFLHTCLDYLEPGYYILANKTNPLSKQEAEFKDIYANVFSLHCLSIVFSIPSGISYYHYFRASRKVPVDTKKVAWARRRLVVFMPLSLAFCFTGYIYESTHNLRNRLMAIEQFYKDHKEEDLNTISFQPQYLQRK